MNKYYVDSISYTGRKYYFICSNDMSVIEEPTKYLKHKTNKNCSPNTVKRIAYIIAYYLAYLKEQNKTADDVLEMKYTEQSAHFVGFLNWLHNGNHCDRNKFPNNNTCNSYLQSVFGFYKFLVLEYEMNRDIQVLESRIINYSGSAGVRFKRNVQTFGEYLPRKESIGRTIQKEKIITLLAACNSVRNRLLILLLVETGFRIGELLGIRYAEDIDYENKTIRVEYREDNENRARAKRAECRRARISDETFDFLLHYIAENRNLLSKTGYLFVNLYGKTKGKALTVDAVYSALRLLEKRTGIKATPHMFRHYFANERRKAGWELDKISFALGHKSIFTTEMYMNIEDEEMAEAMKKYFEKNKGLYDIDKLI